jgi:hypothetical protein
LQNLIAKVLPQKKNEVGATVAYFLEFHASEPVAEWKPEEVGSRFTDVRKPKPQNMTDLIVKSEFFMKGSQRGYYKLSEPGVKWVETRLEGNAT